MAIEDIKILKDGAFGVVGSRKYAVSSSATKLNAGEPVKKELGTSGIVVAPAATNFPQVGTDYMVGIAASNSTHTSTATGTVEVIPLVPGQVYLISPKVAATYDTQDKYDALVGSRVLIDLTSGSYTILAADAAGNGCVIEPLDVAKYPGKVAFSVRAGASYLA
jgi:hypothetical protein